MYRNNKNNNTMETVNLSSALTITGLTISGEFKLHSNDINYGNLKCWLVYDSEGEYLISEREAKSAIN